MNDHDFVQQIEGALKMSDSSAGILQDCAEAFQRIIFANAAGDKNKVNDLAYVELTHVRYALNMSEVEPPERQP
jgi:hypothetical protein